MRPTQAQFEPPSFQLRRCLVYLRRLGVEDFDEAYERARDAIRMPHDTQNRREWATALDETRSAWEAAWNGERTPGDALVVAREFLMAREDRDVGASRAVGRFKDKGIRTHGLR